MTQTITESITQPLCQYFGKCGGCTAQHIAYEQQLENKKTKLHQTINKLINTPLEIEIFSDQPYYYRNRMDFIFHNDGLGLREKDKAWKIVDIERCVISNQKINQLLNEIRTFFRQIDAFDAAKKTGTYKYAVIRAPETSQQQSSISFVLNSDSPRITEAVEQIKLFAEKTTALSILITYTSQNDNESTGSDFFVVKGTNKLQEHFLGKKFNYSTQGFFQNNSILAEKMQSYVRTTLQKYSGTNLNYSTHNAQLLDLYGGVGTFGIINADLFKQVTIVESFPGCVDAAQENIKLNNLKNTTAVCLEAKSINRLNLYSPLFVITDPPRSGMDQKTIEILNYLQPHVIVYISCNLQQLKKDLQKFKKYIVKKAAIFDLFPQTPHCEGIIVMEKK